jgi:glutamine synthetase
MVCLTHEKPFAGVNGSGKHVNFSIGNSTQGNLLDPGDTAEENAQFLAFCAAVIRAVHKNSTLLRAVIASAGNDHRLGANEAPPAILSVFLGQEFTEVFEAIARGESGNSKEKAVLKLGVDLLPDLPKDVGDRNRTSPFAFIGNRFEFRAVGSNSSIAGPLVAINTILADSIDWICEQIEEVSPNSTEELNETLQKIIGNIWNEHKAIVFNGDGYSEEWHREAVEDRGLPNLESTADALPVLVDDQYVEMFDKYNVLNKRELESRLSIYIEQYTMQLNVEANLTIEIARTQILPAAMKYLGQLASTAEEVQDLGLEPEMSIVSEVNDGIKALKSAVDALIETKASAPEDDEIEEALYMKDEVFPAMEAVREAADALEELVDDELWPLPTYQEMLFIK